MTPELVSRSAVTISVVIPFHQSVEGLKDLLESFRGLVASREIEVVLVADREVSIEDTSVLLGVLNGVTNWNLSCTIRGSGPGFARNCGLKAARGRYVGFVDSDDRVNWGILLELSRSLESNGFRVGRMAYEVSREKGNRETAAQVVPRCGVQTLAGSILERAAPWSFVVERELLARNRIKFPEWHGSGGEDVVFLLRVAEHENQLWATNSIGYTYRVGSPHQTTAQPVADDGRRKLLQDLARIAAWSLSPDVRSVASCWFARSWVLWICENSYPSWYRFEGGIEVWKNFGNSYARLARSFALALALHLRWKSRFIFARGRTD